MNRLTMGGLSSIIDDSYDFIIMAKVRANGNTAATRNTSEARFYLPNEIFLPLCDNPHHHHRRGVEDHHWDHRYRKLCQLRSDQRHYLQKGICHCSMLVIYPFLILLTVAIPALLYRKIARAGIIERLQQ